MIQTTAERMNAQYVTAAAQAATLGAGLVQRTDIRNAAYHWALDQGTPQKPAETFADWAMAEAKAGRTFASLAQAWDAYFDAIASAGRSDERARFLGDVLVCAIESGSYAPFTVEEYDCTDGDPRAWFAVIRYDQEPTENEPVPAHRVTLDTIAAGLGVIRRAAPKVDDEHPNDGPVLHNSRTGARLYLSQRARAALLAADKANDAGDIDVIGAFAIVECALLGSVTYG